MSWVVYAFLSALFAALTSILAKVGVENINSNLATAVRTVVVLFMAWGIVFATGRHHELTAMSQRNWLFLTLSGCATGLSWLFYYKALQLEQASKVIPIDKFSVVLGMLLAYLVLGETVDAKSIAGGALITMGVFVLIL